MAAESQSVLIELPTVTVVVGGKAPYTFRELVEYLVDNDPRFQRPASNARAGQRLLDSLDGALASRSDTWKIERSEDWKLLSAIAENPTCGYARFEERDAQGNKRADIHVPTRLLLPYLDAIQMPAAERQPEQQGRTNNGGHGVPTDGATAQISQGETTCPA